MIGNSPTITNLYPLFDLLDEELFPEGAEKDPIFQITDPMRCKIQSAGKATMLAALIFFPIIIMALIHDAAFAPNREQIAMQQQLFKEFQGTRVQLKKPRPHEEIIVKSSEKVREELLDQISRDAWERFPNVYFTNSNITKENLWEIALLAFGNDEEKTLEFLDTCQQAVMADLFPIELRENGLLFRQQSTRIIVDIENKTITVSYMAKLGTPETVAKPVGKLQLKATIDFENQRVIKNVRKDIKNQALYEDYRFVG